LKQKMSIQKDGLHTCKEGIPSVQMTPASLDHSNLRIGKEMDRAFKEVLFRHKVGVQDAKKFTFRSSKSHGKGASLESGAISPMDPLDVETTLPQFLGTNRSDFARIIR